jgi:excisionase family DNA binding protein
VSSAPTARRHRAANDDDLLNVEQVAEELGISRSTFYRWRCLRKGPDALKLPNGQIRIRRSALEQFLATCELRP